MQILCITHQAQVVAQSDQHLLVQKKQTDPASSAIIKLQEDGRIQELARMTGGVEIGETTLQRCRPAAAPAEVSECMKCRQMICRLFTAA